MTNKKLWILTATSVILATLGLALILNYTSPDTAGPFGILMTFAMVYLFCFTMIFAVWRALHFVWQFFRPSKQDLDRRVRTTRRRMLYISLALAFAPLFLISLNSIGQLQIRDGFLIGLIEILAIFYIIKRT